MHGGAPGSGAPKGARNGNYKHGLYTAALTVARTARRRRRNVGSGGFAPESL
jgi:hypothetical protein